MHIFRHRSRASRWARQAMKWGLIFTDAPLWEAVVEDLRHATESVSDRVRRKYDGRLDREQEERMTASLRGPDWFGRTTSLLTGIGIGLGLGLLFAPTSGHETREMIRDKAEDFKDRIADAASHTIHFRPSSNVTGTDGD